MRMRVIISSFQTTRQLLLYHIMNEKNNEGDWKQWNGPICFLFKEKRLQAGEKRETARRKSRAVSTRKVLKCAIDYASQ